MQYLVPGVASVICGVMIVESTVVHPARVMGWTVVFAFWTLVTFLPRHRPRQGTVIHNTIPHIRK